MANLSEDQWALIVDGPHATPKNGLLHEHNDPGEKGATVGVHEVNQVNPMIDHATGMFY